MKNYLLSFLHDVCLRKHDEHMARAKTHRLFVFRARDVGDQAEEKEYDQAARKSFKKATKWLRRAGWFV